MTIVSEYASDFVCVKKSGATIMKFRSLLLGASAAAGAAFLTAPASATPFTVYYDVTDLGGSYQYDIDVVLDNNDGSWSSGQEFDWRPGP